MEKNKKSKRWGIVILAAVVLLGVIYAAALGMASRTKVDAEGFPDMTNAVMGDSRLFLNSFIDQQLPDGTDFLLWGYEDNSKVEDKEFIYLFGIFSLGKTDVGYILLGRQSIREPYTLLAFETFEGAFDDNGKLYHAEKPVVLSMNGEASPETTREVIFFNGRKNKDTASYKITGKDGDTSVISGSGAVFGDVGFCMVSCDKEPGTVIEIHYTDSEGKSITPVYRFVIE